LGQEIAHVKYWLLKTEPSSFSVDDLAAAPKRTSAWDGVRNFQARNMLRDDFAKGDLAFLYHSSCDEPGIAGIVTVVKPAYPDATAFDPKHHHFDAASDPKNPRWFMVDVRLVRKLRRIISLEELKRHARKELAQLIVLRRGNRLSITPMSKAEWDFILSLE
jgi:predicted RNA-binding protein with PUA-like domain